SPATRCSGRCCRCSPSAPPTRPWRRPTTPPTGCRRGSGRRRARASWPSPTGCAPAWCGRTRSTSSTPRRRSAATSSPATAARAAGAPAYNRGQVLYRVAEVMEARRAQSGGEVADAGGPSSRRGGAVVDAASDRCVWYAGWTDKLAAVLGGANPVAGPYFNLSVPEPTGVVAVLAPQRSALLGLVSVLAPVLATGCTAVVVTSKDRPLPAVTLGEVLATSDVPAGVVNLLTGDAGELGPWLAEHADVDALDLTGCPARRAAELERSAADTIKRLVRPPATEPDWSTEPGLTRMTPFLETKTVWHPMGL